MKPQTLQSVQLTFQIIQQIAAEENDIGVSEISRRLNQSKATVHRHLITLKEEGIVIQNKNNKYSLGWTLFDLGVAAANQYNIVNLSKSAMEKLTKSTGLSCLLGLRNHHHVIVIESIDSTNHIAVTVKSGLRLKAASSASGRIMLAYSQPALVNNIIQNVDFDSVKSIFNTKDKLKSQLKLIRQQSYEFAKGESQYGVSALAAPITNSKSEFQAVISLIGTEPQIGDPPHPQLIQSLLDCTNNISQLLN